MYKRQDYKNIEVEVDKSYEISDNSVQETIENYFLTAPIYTENKEKEMCIRDRPCGRIVRRCVC